MKQLHDALVIITSDWHDGSILAGVPDDFLLPNGSKWTQNIVQLWLRERKDEFWRWARLMAKKRRVIVVVNGDVIEGVHHSARELVTLNKEYHRRIALEEIKMFRKPDDKWLFVRGTPVHDGFEGEDIEAIAREAGCAQHGDGTYSYQVLKMSVNGVTFNIAHHIGTTSAPASEATALTTQLVKAARDVGMWGTTMPTIIARAHRHKASRVWLAGTDQGRLIFTTPAQVARGEHGACVEPTSPPQVGGAIIQINGDGAWQPYFKDWALPEEDMEIV